MNIWQKLFGRKASDARILLSMNRLGQPVTTPANYEALTKIGYAKNATVYRCIRLIATACAGIEWEVYDKSSDTPKELENSPLQTLINRPNPMMGWAQFMEAVVSYFAMSGNSYIESVGPSPNKPPMELWPLRPDYMRIIPGRDGYPAAYEFKVGGVTKRWDCDFVSMQCPVLHAKTFNPLDIWYGMSPMEAALLSVESNNAAGRWNTALLQNSATPSGVLKVKQSDANVTGSLTEPQYERLKEEFYQNHVGARNTGRPLLLEGGLDWQSISYSPKDMEWLKGREVTALDICTVFGVPGQLLGLGESTYSNYKEARLAFYEDTVLPLMDFFKFEFNQWLAPRFGENLCMEYDKDDIEPLVEKREARFTAVKTADWLTQNEKREATGYEPVEGMDVFVIGAQIIDPNAPEPATEPNPNNEEDPMDNEEDPQDPPTNPQEEIDDSEKSFKFFNRITKFEKQGTVRAANRKRQVLEAPFERSLKLDFDEMVAGLAEAAKGKEPRLAEFAMLQELDKHSKDIEKTIRKYIRMTVDDFGEPIFQQAKSDFHIVETKKNEKTWRDWADRYVKTRSAKAISEIQGTTKKQVHRIVRNLIAQSLEEGGDEINFAKELQNEFDGLTPGRARTIARTEVAMASNQATLEAAKSLEIPNLKKEWVSLQDDRTRDGSEPLEANHLDMDGVKVDLDEKFSVPPDATMDGPGDESGGPGQVCNCRCVLTFATGVRD